MSRHLVDPELAVGIDGPMTQRLDSETLGEYRTMLEEVVAAIPPAPEPGTDPRTAIKRALHGEAS